MGAFWTYFRDTLRWPHIFRPGPLSALLEGLARVLDDAREDVLWFRRQISPVTCEDQYLDRHARGRRITRYPAETDAQYRTRVCRAYGWHLLGGKASGLPQIVGHYGYQDARVVNIRDEDHERFAEFRLTLEGQRITADGHQLLTDLAQTYKRATSKLEAIRYTESQAGILSTGAAVRVADVQRVPIHVSVDAGPTLLSTGAAVRCADVVRIGLQEPTLAAGPTTLYFGGAIRAVDIIHIGVAHA